MTSDQPAAGGREPKPPPGRVAGVDFGTLRMGVAISDPQQSIASPLVGYQCAGPLEDGRWFKSLAEREEIVAWVVGLPVYASGDESPKSAEARKFGKWLEEVTKLPVFFFDERYSTAQADQHLAAGKLTRKRKQARRDMLAAQIILATFLDSQNRAGTVQPLDDAE